MSEYRNNHSSEGRSVISISVLQAGSSEIETAYDIEDRYIDAFISRIDELAKSFNAIPVVMTQLDSDVPTRSECTRTWLDKKDDIVKAAETLLDSTSLD